jgi:YD repeat-containing protein
MKTLIFFLVVVSTLSLSLNGQTSYFDYTVKAPEVSSLLEVKSPSINENQGKPNISIPLYLIDLGDVKLPISLNYTLGGTKVEYESSWLGNSWTLAAGGVITRKLIGLPDELDDYAFPAYPGYNTSTSQPLYPPCQVLWLKEDKGWFMNAEDKLAVSNYFKQNGNLTNYTGTIPELADNSPDIFYYTLPKGVSGNFLFQSASTIISSGKEKITYGLNGDGIIVKFEICDENGNRFLFEEYSLTGNDFRESSRSKKSVLSDKPSFVPFFSYPERPCDEGQYQNYTNSDNGSINAYTKEYGDSWFLSKIILTSTDNVIEYSYEDTDHVSLLNTRSQINAIGANTSSNAYNYTQTKALTSIEWGTGKMDLIKKPNVREDVLSTANINGHVSELKALDKINIYDNHDKLIKRITFQTSYNEATNIENEMDPNNLYLYKRLWLDGITINDFSDNPESYSFNYNQTKLPPRLSFEQDYWGYYNSNGADSDGKCFLPELWFYPNDPRSYTRPTAFSIFRRTNYQGQEMTLSQYFGNNIFSDRSANINFAKAGVLEDIVYPSSGKVKYEYELNSFLVEDKTIEGAGLRVKKVTSVPIVGENIVDEYHYTNQQGVTLGVVPELKSFGRLFSAPSDNSPRKYIMNSSPIVSDVYYSTVEKRSNGNGKTVTTYLIPYSLDSESSLYSDLYQDHFYEKNYGISNFIIETQPTGTVTYGVNTYDYGEPPTSLNYSHLFGKVLTKETYDSDDNPVGKDIFDYDFTGKSERIFSLTQSSFPGDRLNTIFIGDLILTSHKNYKFYNINNTLENVVVSNNYEYNSDAFLSKRTTVDSEGDIISYEYKYPMDFPTEYWGYGDVNNDGIPEPAFVPNFYGDMVTGNYLNYPIEIVEKVNNTIVSAKINQYGRSFGKYYLERGYSLEQDGYPYAYDYAQVQAGKWSPSLIKDANMVQKVYFSRYFNGNPWQFNKTDERPITIVWGYSNTKIIAVIEGVDYSQASNWYYANSGNSFNGLSTLSDNDIDDNSEQVLRDNLNDLRQIIHENDPNVRVDTYTYDPLIGVTSITDPKGYTVYYEYDDFNRLKQVKDADGHILSENEYNYKQ